MPTPLADCTEQTVLLPPPKTADQYLDQSVRLCDLESPGTDGLFYKFPGIFQSLSLPVAATDASEKVSPEEKPECVFMLF